MKTIISNLISNGKLEAALELFMKECQLTNQKSLYNDLVLQSARYHSNERDNRVGLVGSDAYNRTRAQITHALLGLLNDFVGSTSLLNNQGLTIDDNELVRIINEFKRKTPELANDAAVLLGELNVYQLTKKTDPLYDPYDKEVQVLTAKYNLLVNKVAEYKEVKTEKLFSDIQGLLSARIPTWESIEKAYVLASGLGMSQPWLVEQIKLQPNLDEAKLRAVGMIEDFVKNVRL